MAMDRKQEHPSAPTQKQTDKPSLRQDQAQAIMQQLVSEGIFVPNEAAEITFSDSAFICIPDTEQKPADKKGVK